MMKSLHFFTFLVLLLPIGLLAADAPKPVDFAAGRMIKQLKQGDWLLQSEALHYLSTHEVPEAADAVAELLENSTMHSWVRGQALLALARMDADDGKKRVETYAGDEDPVMRAAAAEACRYTGGPQSLLDRLLNDKIKDVQFHALASHAQLNHEKAWPLVDTLTRSLDPSHSEQAAFALSRCGGDAARQRLSELCSKGPTYSAVLRGLRGVQDPKLIPILVDMMGHVESDRDRSSILSILQTYKREDLVAQLTHSLGQGGSTRVRAVAKVMTRLFQFHELGEPMRDALLNVKDSETVLAGLASIGTRPMKAERFQQYFSTQLKHDDYDVRRTAVLCLRHCGDLNYFPILKGAVSDEHPVVSSAALEVLIDSPEEHKPEGSFIEYLELALQVDDKRIRRLAWKVLARASAEDEYASAMKLFKARLQGKDDEQRKKVGKIMNFVTPEDRLAETVAIQGILSTWHLLGTFMNDKEFKGFDTVYPPEEKIDFTETMNADYRWLKDHTLIDKKNPRDISWKSVVVDNAEGKMYPGNFCAPPAAYALAYAVANVTVKADREVFMSVDGDDAFRLWLNGEKLVDSKSSVSPFDKPFLITRPCVTAKKNIKIKLKAGDNRFLVKSATILDEWWFRVRLSDAEGKAVVLSGKGE